MSLIFALSFVTKFYENVFLRFLLLMYRQSIERKNLCVSNLFDRQKSLKNAKLDERKDFLSYSKGIDFESAPDTSCVQTLLDVLRVTCLTSSLHI